MSRRQSYLKQNFSEDIGIDVLAEQLGISRSHLIREFKRENGMTINQYLTQLRIEQAKTLLADHIVTETAFEGWL